ncbi:MAG: hypothetical protein KDE23_24475 [Caldilinea sp.]|nr:hypothetical protein [Caldilinea sp.]
MQSAPEQRSNPKDGDGWKQTIREQLSRLNGLQHERKKKDTLIALIDANMSGKSEETVWEREDTCARSTWHEKWKRDPLIADVLERARRVAHAWRDGLAANTLAEAAELLALESYASVQEAARLRDESEDDRVRLQAAFGILDRADIKTATKVDVRNDVRNEVHHELDATVFDILAQAGALQSGADAGADDEVHPPQADA